jgi:hypothetical protein
MDPITALILFILDRNPRISAVLAGGIAYRLYWRGYRVIGGGLRFQGGRPPPRRISLIHKELIYEYHNRFL